MRFFSAVALTLLALSLHPACDCGGATPGTGDAGGSDAWVGNRPPLLPVYSSISMLPGDTVSLVSAPISDPDGDALTCTWTASPTLTSVTVPGGCGTPEAVIDRARYEAGPAEQRFTIAASVSDGSNPAVTATIEVVIGDERGGHVNNVSRWEGTGYTATGDRHGFCGAQAHPCQGIDDAKVNLRALIEGGVNVDPTIMVATSGVAYAISDPILLDDDAADTGIALGLECGFDPATWQKVSGSWTHTPIRYSGEWGVHVTADGVQVEGCNVEGVEPSGQYDDRFAIFVDNAEAAMLDNVLVGVNSTVTTLPQRAVGLRIELDNAHGTARPVVDGNRLTGGRATIGAIGLQAAGGLPLVARNTILGAEQGLGNGVNFTPALAPAQTTPAEISDNPQIVGSSDGTGLGVGLLVSGGNPRIRNNAHIAGCAVATATGACGGLGVFTGADSATVENNTIIGNASGQFARAAIGLSVTEDVVTSGNNIRGGLGMQVSGMAVSDTASLESTGDTVVGGTASDEGAANPRDGWVAGLMVGPNSSATLVNTDVRAAAAGAATPSPRAMGIYLDSGTTLHLTGGRIESGAARDVAIGVEMVIEATAATLIGSTVVANKTMRDISNGAIGIHHLGGTLSVTRGRVEAGDASKATGIQNDYSFSAQRGAGDTTIDGTTVTGLTGVSWTLPLDYIGIHHKSGKLTLRNATVLAPGATYSTSGIVLNCGDAACASQHHLVTSSTVSTGSSQSTYGARASNADALEITDSEVSAAAIETGGYDSLGMDLRDTTATLADVTATAGHSPRLSVGIQCGAQCDLTATNVNAVGGAAPISNGLRVLEHGIAEFDDGRATGGPCDGSAGSYSSGIVSISTSYSHYYRNELRGGDGCESSFGFSMQGNGFFWLYNNRASGGAAAKISAGIWLPQECQTCRFSGNIARGGSGTAGASSRSVGMHLWLSNFDTEPLMLTYVVNNVLYGGTANVARGLEVGGDSGGALIVMHNDFHGEGAAGVSGSISSAVYLMASLAGSANSGLFANNIVDAGVAEQRYGYDEACGQIMSLNRWGRPYQVRRSAFWPNMSAATNAPTAYVRHANSADCTAPVLYTATAQVDADVDYGQAVGGYLSLTFDPKFAADGYHLLSNSQLIGMAGYTADLWPFDPNEAMVDIDGEARPCGPAYEIGADELCP